MFELSVPQAQRVNEMGVSDPLALTQQVTDNYCLDYFEPLSIPKVFLVTFEGLRYIASDRKLAFL